MKYYVGHLMYKTWRVRNTGWAKSRYTVIIYILYTVCLLLAHLICHLENYCTVKFLRTTELNV